MRGRRTRGKIACLTTDRDEDREIERKKSAMSRDGERQLAMEGGAQTGNEMSWEFGKIKEQGIERGRVRKGKVVGGQE